MPTNQPSPLSLREIRCKGFIQKLENRPVVEMLQYGNVTLIHKKLDSWIDSKPDLEAYTCWTEDHQMLKLEHDHLKCRKQRLSKKRGKLERSWSGNIQLIQRDSMIDMLPKAAALQQVGKKRSKPRRVGTDDNSVVRHTVRAKDVLLDGDIQSVRKVILEKKLCNRPMLPNAQEYQEALYSKLRELQDPKPIAKAKPAPTRMVRRHLSADRVVRRPRVLMPQSA